MAQLDLVFNIIASLGGVSVVTLGLSTWIGKVLATRIAAKEQVKLIEKIVKLEADLELSRHNNIRNSDARFKLYNDLWNILCDLKIFGDRLWQRVTIENLIDFTDTLRNARIAADRGRLILKEAHYQDLSYILESFENYQIGKLKLIEAQNNEELNEQLRDDDISVNLFIDQIDKNKSNKEKYENLLTKIVFNFREQLGLKK